MRQDLLITRDRWQTQIAVLEDARLVEYFSEPRHLDGLVGNLYVGRVNRILPGMESAFVDVGLDRDGFLFEGDMGSARILDEEAEEPAVSRSPSVKNLREGERILIQVIKEPMGAKGARLSTQLSLPGHYMIFMPYGNHVAVSRKISGSERMRLREMVKETKSGYQAGFIVRTAAEGAADIVWLATLPDDGPSGKFFRDRLEQAW
jgi:ribonuclease G